MKILLVSDSHGYDDELKKVLENVKCDLKIHCGDSCFDKNSPFIKEFAAIVDGNQISHSKPDPEVFLLAAEKLHQKPSDCLVVEDAEAGVKAALNGGFLVAGIGPAKDCPNVNYQLLSLSELLAIEGHPA